MFIFSVVSRIRFEALIVPLSKKQDHLTLFPALRKNSLKKRMSILIQEAQDTHEAGIQDMMHLLVMTLVFRLLVSQGFCYEWPQMEWLKTKKCSLSLFWRLKV